MTARTETVVLDDGRTFTGTSLLDEDSMAILSTEDRGIVTLVHIPLDRIRQRIPADSTPAPDDMPGAPVLEDGPLEPPFFVHPFRGEDSFPTLAEAAQEAEHRHAETGRPVQVIDRRGEEAYVSKGAPDDEPGC